MGTCRALILAGAAVVAPVAAALAADLPPPPVLMPPPVEFGGWYLRGDVGVGSYESTDFRSTFEGGNGITDGRFDQQSIGDAAFAGGGIGYQFNSWLRVDATGEYRTEQAIHAVESYDCSALAFNPCLPANGGFSTPGGDGRGYDRYTGKVQSTVAMVNAYADIGTWYGVTPFVGAGVGVAFNHVSGVVDQGIGGAPTYSYVDDFGQTQYGGSYGFGGYGFAKSRTTTDFAWAVMAGLSYAVTPNVALEIGYRHLDMGEAKIGPIDCAGGCGPGRETQKIHLASDDVRLGFRWLFADVAPAPVPYPLPPLIRKD